MRWHWQYLIPPIIWALSVDWVLIPLIKSRGINSWALFVITSILAVVELFCWYWFWSWFRQVSVPEFAGRVAENKKIQEGIELGEKIKITLKNAGLWEKIKTMILDYVFNTYRYAIDENNRFIKWIKRGGGFGMIILGILPEPGTRMLGAIFCGTTGWKNGIYPLALGNILRVAYMVGLWHIIFSVF